MTTPTYADLVDAGIDGTTDYNRVLDSDLGGYRLAKYKEAGGEETRRFEADITKDGKTAMHVYNTGTGGENVYSAWGPDYDDLLAHAKAWSAAVEDLYASETSPDEFVDHLVACAEFSRKRGVLFVTSDVNPFKPSDGRYFVAPAATPREVVVRDLQARADKFPGARVWNKAEYRFEPVSA